MQSVSHEAALENAQGNLDPPGEISGAEAELELHRNSQPHLRRRHRPPTFAGETAASGAPLITVMDTSALIAKVHIAQMQAQ